MVRGNKYTILAMAVGITALVVAGCLPQPSVEPTPPIPPETRTFHATMDGDLEGINTEATGEAEFTVSEDGTEIHYILSVSNLLNVNQAHIHLLPVPGPVVAWLYPDAPPPVLIEGVSDGILAVGTIRVADLMGPLSGGTIADLAAAMEQGNTYVNVHTEEYPAGEIGGIIGNGDELLPPANGMPPANGIY